MHSQRQPHIFYQRQLLESEEEFRHAKIKNVHAHKKPNHVHIKNGTDYEDTSTCNDYFIPPVDETGDYNDDGHIYEKIGLLKHGRKCHNDIRNEKGLAIPGRSSFVSGDTDDVPVTASDGDDDDDDDEEEEQQQQQQKQEEGEDDKEREESKEDGQQEEEAADYGTLRYIRTHCRPVKMNRTFISADEVEKEYQISERLAGTPTLLTHLQEILAANRYREKDVAVLTEGNKDKAWVLDILQSAYYTVQDGTIFPVEHIVVDTLSNFEGLESPVILFIVPESWGKSYIGSLKYRLCIASRAISRLEFLVPWDPRGRQLDLLELRKAFGTEVNVGSRCWNKTSNHYSYFLINILHVGVLTYCAKMSGFC